MGIFNKKTYIKLLLIILAEFLAVFLTDLFSKYVMVVQHTTLTYILSGSILAVIVVVLYDSYLERKKRKIKEEIQELTDVTLMRYHIEDDTK